MCLLLYFLVTWAGSVIRHQLRTRHIQTSTIKMLRLKPKWWVCGRGLQGCHVLEKILENPWNRRKMVANLLKIWQTAFPKAVFTIEILSVVRNGPFYQKWHGKTSILAFGSCSCRQNWPMTTDCEHWLKEIQIIFITYCHPWYGAYFSGFHLVSHCKWVVYTSFSWVPGEELNRETNCYNHWECNGMLIKT